MGLVKTRRLAAMQKQQRAKAGMRPPVKKGAWKGNGSFPLRNGSSSRPSKRGDFGKTGQTGFPKMERRDCIVGNDKLMVGYDY